MNPKEELAKLQKKQRDEFRALIARMITERPDLLYAEIGEMYGLTAARIAQIAVEHDVRRPRGPKAR
jgi:hypothetical protein